MSDTQTRVFKFKLREPNTGKAEALDQTLTHYRQCVNLWIQKIAELNEYPARGNVHDHAYDDVKSEFPDLYSNTIQECMNRAIEIMRNQNGSLPEYTAESMSFKAVDIQYDDEFIGVPVTGKERVWLPLIVPQYFSKYTEYEKGRAQVLKHDDVWYALISVEYPIKEPIEPEGVLGVDLGIRQVAVVSDPNGKVNEFYGSDLLSRRCELDAKWHALQEEKNGENNVYRAFHRISGKESQFMDDVNHKIAKEIVETAKHYRYAIAMENLTGLRKGSPSKTLQKMLHRWAYRDLADKIEYKAEAVGIPVEYVDPRSTSKTCSQCGEKTDIGSNAVFKCKNCGYELNRDLNGARNVAKRSRFLSAVNDGASALQSR